MNGEEKKIEPRNWEETVDSWALQADMFKPEDFDKTVKPFIRDNFISKAKVINALETVVDKQQNLEALAALRDFLYALHISEK